MSRSANLLNRLISVLVVVGLVLAAYFLWARPYQLRWSATNEEVARPMPGDELDPDPTFLATRAITIDAPPEAIWPWLVQIGYDILENLGSPSGLLSAERIVPEWQNFKVGDVVPISAVAAEVFYAIEPNRYLIWAGQTGQYPGGFTWALYPVDEAHARLVSRIRWSHHGLAQPGLFALDLLTEFTDHLAVRKVLQGVKGRVEGHFEPMALTNIEFFTYVASALIFVVGLVLIVLRPLTWPRWLMGLAAGGIWLFTWYTPMAFWLGLILELGVVWGLLQAFRRNVKAD